ncbi:DUF1254 domain-containing protein [Polyangium sorediatum]|uniref:DUF1254 domain-containing protein n=1 Tax=Polyangium sorediatum TaxID=889274 RepID=A0ABT6NL32_9BACT|nr:DUF1254 domain-containing protein [Polyangium sorediatum]MDI1429029.1 DUF1254 domain-containing protein [Polyangium sorediatum]
MSATKAKTSDETIMVKPPGYNTEIPVSILTPPRVETSIGTLEFFDGFPTEETARKVFDFLDMSRGVKVFLDGIPAASLEAIRIGMEDIGVTQCNHVGIAEKLLDSNSLLLTGNTDTVYASAFLDLKRDGPTVIEIPPNCGPSTINDAWFRFVVDMGIPGLDAGHGGKYLILPPDYPGDYPEGRFLVEDGYFVAKSRTYVNWVILRGFLVNGSPDAATDLFKTGLKIYPQSLADKPPAMKFVNFTNKIFNTIHSNDFSFYDELARVIEKEPLEMIDLELRGLIASIGIQKDKTFAPDPRMRGILTDAVAVGNATARALVFQTRESEAYLYPGTGSEWKTGFLGGSFEWLKDDGLGGRYLDARTLFFYQATVNTPAMVVEMIGKGSQYAYINKDSGGNFLDGANVYRLRIPRDVPAKDFWSVVVYDPQTRSELQTSQLFPSKNSQRSELAKNTDGSVDLYFGPMQPPESHPNNWIQTIAGKGWFGMLRLYGPLAPWFDKTWRPGEIELIPAVSPGATGL